MYVHCTFLILFVFILLQPKSELQSPPKKANNKLSSDSGSALPVTNSSAAKSQNAKQRAIPSGITITPRLSPTSQGDKNVNTPSLNASSLAASFLAFKSGINDERQASTSPKPQPVGNFNPRKRKTPTPPQALPRLSAKNYSTMTNSSPAKAATTVAPLPPIMPMITGVHSMGTAGATPPMQLMATPPHNLGAFMGLNEQLMINPHLIPTGLPPNTTITAHPNPNQNYINNNFKIHLPFNKPTTTTPSPAASPASSAPTTPSPQLTSSPQPGRGDKSAGRRIKPTTVIKSSDENWHRQKQLNTQNDKQNQRIPVSLNDDVVIEMLPPSSTESPKSVSASSSRHHTPMTSPTTPKSQKSPDVLILSAPTEHKTRNAQKDGGTILDLTHSPDKPMEIVDLVNTPDQQNQKVNGEGERAKPEKKPEKPPPKPPLEPEYEELIKVCREADSSKDMEKLIKSKLIKYYYEVHSDFVKSKSFRKSIRKVIDAIKAKPDLVYYNLKTIVEELKVRRNAILVDETTVINAEKATDAQVATNKSTASPELNSKNNSIKTATTTDSNVPDASTTTVSTTSAGEITATASTSTGNKKLNEQIKKLNKALYVLTKRIEVLEQTEVDWDDDDSSFLQVERFKKRACQIYEKICDLTGESKNAHRLVKKPIKFNETRIPQFNKTLQAFINRTKEFPDYYDVLRMLEHCNRTYSLGLVNFEMKNIAEDAFIKVGKLLQSRRKADLYETVTHYAGDNIDPAKTDPTLAAKLSENLKNHKRINDILEKFARQQDMPDEEGEEKAEKTPESMDNTTTENKAEEVAVKQEKENSEFLNKEELQKEQDKIPVLIKAEKTKSAMEDEEDDDEDDDEEEEVEEDEENLDEQVETLANGDVSENESDTEILIPKGNENEVNGTSKQDESIKTKNDNSLNVVEKTLHTTKSPSDNDNITVECIKTTDNSTETLKKQDNVMEKNSEILKKHSETESVLKNNKNIDVDITSNTKTVITENITNECSLTSPASHTSSIAPATITPTRNGKLKDSPPPNQHNLLHNKTATAIITSSTRTADLKIVHVASLEPDSNNANNNNKMVGSNLCTDLTLTPASKSLEEIVISDEES